MRYGVLLRGDIVYLTECRNDDGFFTDHPEYKVFHDFSKAIDAMYDALQLYMQVYYYATCDYNHITIIASGDMCVYEDLQVSIDGPYNDPLIAYGYERFKMAYSGDSNNQRPFDIGTRVIYDYYADCDTHQYCRVRLPDINGMPLNICPINEVGDLKSGEQFILRLIGHPKEICVYASPAILQKSISIPVDVLIPTGIYHTEPWEQDTSVAFTGQVQQARLCAITPQLRYQLVIHCMSVEIELDVSTNYEIHDGDYVYVSTDLSADFR